MEDILAARRAKAEEQFNLLVKQRDQKESEIKEIDTELARLQGEYRLADDLLKGDLSKDVKDAKVSPKANVVDVDTAIKEKK